MKAQRAYFVLGIPVLALLACAGERTASPTWNEPLPRDGLRREALGCFFLLMADGRRASDTLYDVPIGVRLDSSAFPTTTSYTSPGVVRALQALDSAGRIVDTLNREITTLRFWSADSLTDSIRLELQVDMSGVTMALAVPKAQPVDTLHGRAMAFWDLGPSNEEAGIVMAVRTPCAASE